MKAIENRYGRFAWLPLGRYPGTVHPGGGEALLPGSRPYGPWDILD